MALKYVLPQIDAGAVYSEVFLYWTRDDVGARTAVDLTGYQGKLMASKKEPPFDILLDWSTESGNIVITGNRIEVTATAVQTKGLKFHSANYDLLLWPAGHPEQAFKFCFGTVSAVPVVTKLG